MISIHTDTAGKYPVAVYECVIRGHVTVEWIANLFPRSYGRNVTAYGYTQTPHETRWHMLIANTRQSTVADITSRIDKKLQQPMGFTVGVVASVMSIGNAPHNGSPREGTKRTRTNSPHRKILAAR